MRRKSGGDSKRRERNPEKNQKKKDPENQNEGTRNQMYELLTVFDMASLWSAT
jgi:hypothetical protein